jgi:hypothetical protein
VKVLKRFVPPEERSKVDAVFRLGRELRRAERGNGEPVNDVGVLLDMLKTTATEWRELARLITEGR